MNEIPRIEIASNAISMSGIYTSCDDLLSMPSCSNVDSSAKMDNACDPLLIVENHELKEQVTKLSKSLERCFTGKATLDKLLSEQRCSFNKEGLGYVPKKGKKPVNKPTRFVKQNGKYCYKCREIGHVQ